MALAKLVRKELARFGDDSPEAVGHRLRAARRVANVAVAEIVRSRRHGLDGAHVEAAEAGLILPNYSLMSFYWQQLKLDSAFIEHGDLEVIPIEIEDDLFAALTLQMGR